MRALESQVAHVLDPAVPSRGLVLAVRGCDRDYSLDREPVIETDVRILRAVLHSIERGSSGRRFSAARMTYERDARQIHLPVKWIAHRLIPLAPQPEMFQQQPAPHSLLFWRVVEEAAVAGTSQV